MYVSFIFTAIYIGYSMGSAPIVSYHYGAKNHPELQNILKKSLKLLGIACAFQFTLAQLIASPLARLFVGYDAQLFQLTQHGFRIFSLTFLISGFNIYGSSFFTALNNGPLSALISFLRTLVFQLGVLLILPLILGIDGIWGSVAVAELLTLMITLCCLVSQRKKYHYA